MRPKPLSQFEPCLPSVSGSITDRDHQYAADALAAKGAHFELLLSDVCHGIELTDPSARLLVWRTAGVWLRYV